MTTTIAANVLSMSEKIKNCINPSCFFCILKEPDSSLKRARIRNYLTTISSIDDQELILVVSGIWKIAMSQPDDQQLPSLGIFQCMSSLINKGIKDKTWLDTNQNIYIPYYAAHIIGSYTMNNVEFVVQAVDNGVIPPLLELLRGKMSWVEQRVAVRALGHLASYDETFNAIAQYEEDIVRFTMHLACTCLEIVFNMFVKVKVKSKGLKYQCDLLTRGVGDLGMENRKAEEWASQIQCWCLHLLSCFAIKERSLNLICNQEFLKNLSEMCGGLANNHGSPAGIGLIRVLCYSKIGRKNIADSRNLIQHLCNLSRSSDDWQYMGIDCLLLLLNDSNTRYKVMEIATLFLVDLIELKNIKGRSNVGERVSRTLILDFKLRNVKFSDKKVQRALEEIWCLKIVKKKREQNLSKEKVEERKSMVKSIEKHGNHSFRIGDFEEAKMQYTKALKLCLIRCRKERLKLYSKRSQCNLMLKDPNAAISDATRALCLSNPPNSHAKSLWRRSQAYDMKGLAKESLIDCVMFINCCFKSERRKSLKIPFYAVRMICKQMNSTWIFRSVQLKVLKNLDEKKKQSHDASAAAAADDDRSHTEQSCSDIMRILMHKKSLMARSRVAPVTDLEVLESNLTRIGYSNESRRLSDPSPTCKQNLLMEIVTEVLCKSLEGLE